MRLSCSRTRGAALETPYDQLRQRILTGELPSGSALVETTLADEFGMSRTPIREALRRLEQDGLVGRDGRMLQVRASSPSQILEIFEVRIVVEGAAARAAAERHTDIDRIRILGHLAKIRDHRAAHPDDIATTAALASQFHRSIWHASHNTTMIDVLERLELHMRRLPHSTFVVPGREEAAMEEHAQLVDAIAARDGAGAQKLAQEHMEIARTLRLQMWEDDPDVLLD